MEVLYANEHSVYAGSKTGFIHKINGDNVGATATIADSTILDLSGTNETLYALTHRKEIHELDANSLEVRRSHTVSYNATCMTFVAGTGELWVGDSTGKIFVLDASSFD